MDLSTTAIRRLTEVEHGLMGLMMGNFWFYDTIMFLNINDKQYIFLVYALQDTTMIYNLVPRQRAGKGERAREQGWMTGPANLHSVNVMRK